MLGTAKISHLIMDVLNIIVSLFNQCFNAFFLKQRFQSSTVKKYKKLCTGKMLVLKCFEIKFK